MDVDNGPLLELRVIMEGGHLRHDSYLVKVNATETIQKLKDAIKVEMQHALADVDADKMRIFKVTLPIENPTANLGGNELFAADSISGHWPSQPPPEDNTEKCIHVVVQRPAAGCRPLVRPRLVNEVEQDSQKRTKYDAKSSQIVRPSSFYPLPQNEDVYAPRPETVHGIYQKLKTFKYIRVQGTSASGKTALAHLLHAYIRQTDPDATVTYVATWPTPETMPARGFRKWLRPRCDFRDGSVLIVDRAQSSYWDAEFWQHLKSITPAFPYSVITFASYGSAGLDIPDSGTNMRICPAQSISLAAVDNGDEIVVGLLLTKTEFDAFVNKVFVGYDFDASLLECVFDVTQGHVGACQDFLRIVCDHASYRSARKPYTYDDFIEGIRMSELLKQLSESTVFARRLPTAAELENAYLAQVLQEVLRKGSIVVPALLQWPPNVIEQTPLRKCFEAGWLHNEAFGGFDMATAYIFASPLHKRSIQWVLSGELGEGVIHETRLMDFAISVIRKFTQLNPTAGRTLGDTAQSIPDAQFRDEFYHACIGHTNGFMLSLPEFGNKHGRIDFFIPSKKWGIELLRNGARLDARSARFTVGEYDKWINDKKMNDYVIIDFRTERPREHQDTDNICYVVSTDNWKTAEVLDNNLEVVDHFVLLPN